MAWALCVAWAASAALLAPPPPAESLATEAVWPARRLTLAWQHTIERVRWEEDYALPRTPDEPALLHATAARVRGSGAGMEPAPDARWQDGWYAWSPQHRWPALVLAHSAYAADHTLCLDGRCAPLSTWLPGDAPPTGGVVRLRACRASR
ncbi:MAG: DUF1850 domain-containing protein [Tepidimonas ignava]|uniref:Uncharacterized protein DUF1850 n=1 Tax=Tepidimonas ignava TaxID=114249 RepID=A0A4R3LH62_9BURK|nr:DUF1850 domain-containing protein [Tepidimonas ignava]MCX7814395.1 DUF1850 domain-containing protein [Tepidimonas ignava]TCS99503.1 uncharacterized protein DUF1850 [Tepidimonas ignava]TSE22003.1 hypothetical protein Tigna_01457 [Tepidimonas ignava]